MKITAKTTKEEMTKYLGENVAEVKKRDKGLFDSIAYADKMYKKDQTKVTRKDLVDLVKDVMALLATPTTPAPKLATENQLKKSSTLKKGSAKKAETKQEEQKMAAKVNLSEPVGTTGAKPVLYSCTMKFVGSAQAFKDLKEYLEMNNNITYEVVEHMAEIENK